MVECECFSGDADATNTKVLIDTWWNVNVRFAFLADRLKCVLIDTWWNVNLYILYFYCSPSAVLIDTWWNVNGFTDTTPKTLDEF